MPSNIVDWFAYDSDNEERPRSDTTPEEGIVSRMKSMFQSRSSEPLRGTPEFFAYRMKKQREDERKAVEESRKRNQVYRLSIRALGISSALKARERFQQQHAMQQQNKREQNSYRMSLRGLSGLLGSRRPSVTASNPRYLSAIMANKTFREEEDGAPLVLYHEKGHESSGESDSENETETASTSEHRADESEMSESEAETSETEASESEAETSETEVSESEAETSETEVSESEAETSEAEVSEADLSEDEEQDTSMHFDKPRFLRKLEAMHKYQPESTIAQILSIPMFKSFTDEEQADLADIVAAGVNLPDANPGMYAGEVADYTTFEDVFDKLVANEFELTSAELQRTYEANWDVLDEALPFSEPVDVTMSASRNVVGYRLPAAMSKKERLQFEADLWDALDRLNQAEPDCFGAARVYSLSPRLADGSENPHRCSDEDFDNLVNGPYMVPDLEDDPYLSEAGFADDWPHGRGAIVTRHGAFAIVYGGEDHLRIVVREEECAELGPLLELLHQLAETVSEDSKLEFAKHHERGFITSNPYKLGSGLDCSAILTLPNMVKKWGLEHLNQELEDMGVCLSHPFGDVNNKMVNVGGLVQVSTLHTFQEAESLIALTLYNAVTALCKQERELE